jgi:hypothetical protein
MKEFFRNTHLYWQDKANEFASDHIDNTLILILAFCSVILVGIIFIPAAIYIIVTKSILFKILEYCL